jgi:Putative Flp pilus-assembly TadE/G-like
MSQSNEIFLSRAHKGRRGQVLIFFTMWLPLLFGMTALVVDFGFIYLDNNELNASTQAAALAGAWAMSQPGATVLSTTNAISAYSSGTGGNNASSNLSTVSMVTDSPSFKCLSTLTSVFGLQCYGPSNSNAIAVTQQVKVPLLFLRMFGGTTATLTATATASMKGATVEPYNVAIIVDSTQSMTQTDSDSNCSNTRISCALAGVRTLLQGLSPCPPNQVNCGTVTGGAVANSVDRVSLFTFPAVTTATLADDYNCSGNAPTIVGYTYPALPASATYQIIGFSSDYRTSGTAGTLNSSSNLVDAIGGKSGCTPLQAIGGKSTYYAQVIRVAQASLAAQLSANPNSQNVLVLLSDGDAEASCTSSSGGVCRPSTDMPGASTNSGVYMSATQECQQAITEAAAAAAAGTRVYTVAYGATSSGCNTDTTSITPCQTMQQMASAPAYFFSDYTASQGGGSCISAAQPVSGLSGIFQVILQTLTGAKLVPNGTT